MNAWIIMLILCGCEKRKADEVVSVSPVHDLKESILEPACGDVLASFRGVPSYYNGEGIDSCGDRHLGSDGYNYGYRWQCVEYVKRYYKDALHHRMPDTYGNAESFFDQTLSHGEYNPRRALRQYHNNNTEKPAVEDILVCPNMAGGLGHVGIIVEVQETELKIIQQNVGTQAYSKFELQEKNGIWSISNDCAGFLRKE